MKYAAKLDIEVPMPFLGKANIVIKKHGFGVGAFDKPRAVRRYLPRKQTELVREQLPESIKRGLVAANLTEIRLLAPHVHLNEMAVINFYLETNGEVTSFWEGEVTPDDSIVSDNGNGYWNLQLDLLTETESFIAQTGDVWLLDTRAPHSVSYNNDHRDSSLRFEPVDDQKRLLMQAFFSIPFNEVRDALHDKII